MPLDLPYYYGHSGEQYAFFRIPKLLLTTDQNGYIYMDEGLADGRYYIREIKAADGYILDTQLKTIDNPDMVLGEMKIVSGPYGPELTCAPFPDQPLESLLWKRCKEPIHTMM